jgi:hypothetical protein
MPAAIKPYSIAVAPDSSLKNVKMRDFMVMLQRRFAPWKAAFHDMEFGGRASKFH